MAAKQGGFVSVVAVAGHNLPEEDGLIGGHTDAYIRVTIGHLTRESSAVSNSLSPVWPSPGEDVPFGVFDSGTPVEIEVWDADGNFLGADDYIGSVTTAVPACSMFLADQCEERTRLPLPGSPECYLANDLTTPNPKASCIEVGFRIQPFQIRITQQPPSVLAGDLTRVTVAIANDWPVDAGNQTSGIWVGDFTTKIFAQYLPFRPMTSGYVIKLKDNERDVTVPDYVKFSINYDAVVAVFRHEEDVRNVPVLPWLASYENTPVGFAMQTKQNQFTKYIGYQRRFPAGSIITIPGGKYQMGSLPLVSQLAVVVRYVRDESPAPTGEAKKFDRAAFMSLFWQFIFPLIPLFLMSGRIILRLKFRCVCV